MYLKWCLSKFPSFASDCRCGLIRPLLNDVVVNFKNSATIVFAVGIVGSGNIHPITH